MLVTAEADKEKSDQSVSAFVQESQNKIRAINIKLQRLLDSYLEQGIEQEIYRTEKAKILSEKKSLEEQKARFTAPSAEENTGQNAWAALRAANEKVGQFSENQILVGYSKLCAKFL